MRYKVVPDNAGGLETLADAHRAVPLVPGSTDDCCARLQSRLGLASRDDATEWLAFLDALGLARETDRGFERVRTDLDPTRLGVAFHDRVFGGREVLDALAAAENPLSIEQVFAAIREIVPTWERNRHADWEAEWTERVRRLLAWAVLFELAEERPAGYVARSR